MTSLKYQPQQKKSTNRKIPMPKKGDRHDAVEIVQFLGYKPKKNGTVPIFEILCHKCNQTREITEVNFRHIKSCGCIQHAHIKNVHIKKRQTPSKYQALVNQPLNNGWTLIEFDDSERNKHDIRMMKYTLQCEHGHTKHYETAYVSPGKKAKKERCWCYNNNPFSRERHRNGLKQQDVGDHFGVSASRVQQWEVHKKAISKARIEQLAEYYGTSDEVKHEMHVFNTTLRQKHKE